MINNQEELRETANQLALEEKDYLQLMSLLQL